MAASVPASLKSSGIVPFATRAQQVEKVKPAVAYWCNYWIVQQIVTKGLHNSDEESKLYTASLMDKLEISKAEHATEDAITDDVAAKAYLEQFGLEVFNRADNAIRNNQATRQTIDTFQAAYTFLELLQIWPPLDPEINTKIKYAKYHAIRIAKALKAGEDPNLSNPSDDVISSENNLQLNAQSNEVRAIGESGATHTGQHPAVGGVRDERHAVLSPADASMVNRPLSTPELPPPASLAGQGNNIEDYYHAPDDGEVSPLAPSTRERANSDGGGYFPQVSQPPPEGISPVRHLPPVWTNQPSSQPFSEGSVAPAISPIQPSPTELFQQGASEHHFPSQQPAPQQPVQTTNVSTTQLPSSNLPPYSVPSSLPPSQFPHSASTSSTQHPAPIQAPVVYTADEEAIAKAQKHARWAISALNFEDIKTAVKELENALQTLGAR